MLKSQWAANVHHKHGAKNIERWDHSATSRFWLDMPIFGQRKGTLMQTRNLQKRVVELI